MPLYLGLKGWVAKPGHCSVDFGPIVILAPKILHVVIGVVRLHPHVSIGGHVNFPDEREPTS